MLDRLGLEAVSPPLEGVWGRNQQSHGHRNRVYTNLTMSPGLGLAPALYLALFGRI